KPFAARCQPVPDCPARWRVEPKFEAPRVYVLPFVSEQPHICPLVQCLMTADCNRIGHVDRLAVGKGRQRIEAARGLLELRRTLVASEKFGYLDKRVVKLRERDLGIVADVLLGETVVMMASPFFGCHGLWRRARQHPRHFEKRWRLRKPAQRSH